MITAEEAAALADNDKPRFNDHVQLCQRAVDLAFHIIRGAAAAGRTSTILREKDKRTAAYIDYTLTRLGYDVLIWSDGSVFNWLLITADWADTIPDMKKRREDKLEFWMMRPVTELYHERWRDSVRVDP